METDYLSMCKNFYAATKIPVTLLKGKYAVYTSFNDITGTSPAYYREDLFPMSDHNPTFCSDSPDIGYGRLLIENTNYNLILGPVFNVPVTEELIRYSSRESGVSLENREQYAELLYAIPLLGQAQFANYLVFLHQCINHKTVPAEQLFLENDKLTLERFNQQTDQMVEDKEEGNVHNTYYFELELYQIIKNGNTDALKKFLSATRAPLKEGKMAQHLLLRVTDTFENETRLYAALDHAIRSSDAAGRGSDGSLYLLLNQAEESELPIIEQRLQKHGISAQPVPFEQQLALVAAATQEGEQR